MKSEELRGKIKEIALYHVSDTNCVDEDGMTTAILSLLETAMQEVIGEDKDATGVPYIEAQNDLREEQRSNLLALVRGERV